MGKWQSNIKFWGTLFSHNPLLFISGRNLTRRSTTTWKESFTRRGFLTACLKASNMRRAKFECGRWAEPRQWNPDVSKTWPKGRKGTNKVWMDLECAMNCEGWGFFGMQQPLGQFWCYKYNYHLQPECNWHNPNWESSQPGNQLLVLGDYQIGWGDLLEVEIHELTSHQKPERRSGIPAPIPRCIFLWNSWVWSIHQIFIPLSNIWRSSAIWRGSAFCTVWALLCQRQCRSSFCEGKREGRRKGKSMEIPHL